MPSLKQIFSSPGLARENVMLTNKRWTAHGLMQLFQVQPNRVNVTAPAITLYGNHCKLA